MEISASREQLLPMLTRAVAVVERRQTLPILGHLLLTAEEGYLGIASTDLEVEVRGRCSSSVQEEGQITVPARKLLDIVRNLSEGSEIRLRAGSERCTLISGRGRYVLGTLPASDFPLMQMDTAAVALQLEEAELRKLLDKTSFAMAQQDVRYYLNGLLLEVERGCIRGVATDGHRLAKYEIAKELELESDRVAVIVPHKTVTELRRQLGATGALVLVKVGERTIQFVVGDCVTTSKLIDGRFPDYERVITTSHGRRACVDREGLRGALVRAGILANEKFRGVRVEFASGLMRIQAHNPEQEQSEEEIDAEFEGEPVTLGFNVAYLGDVLGVVERQQVEVQFQDAGSSSVWRGVGAEEETFVVMPIRL